MRSSFPIELPVDDAYMQSIGSAIANESAGCCMKSVGKSVKQPYCSASFSDLESSVASRGSAGVVARLNPFTSMVPNLANTTPPNDPVTPWRAESAQGQQARFHDEAALVARYYGVPSVSLRDVIWHRMKANGTFHNLTLQQLYYDRIHPSNHGHTILAHNLVHLIKRANLLLELSALESQATLATAGAIPQTRPQQPQQSQPPQQSRQSQPQVHEACAANAWQARSDPYHHPQVPPS